MFIVLMNPGVWGPGEGFLLLNPGRVREVDGLLLGAGRAGELSYDLRFFSA